MTVSPLSTAPSSAQLLSPAAGGAAAPVRPGSAQPRLAGSFNPLGQRLSGEGRSLDPRRNRKPWPIDASAPADAPPLASQGAAARHVASQLAGAPIGLGLSASAPTLVPPAHVAGVADLQAWVGDVRSSCAAGPAKQAGSRRPAPTLPAGVACSASTSRLPGSRQTAAEANAAPRPPAALARERKFRVDLPENGFDRVAPHHREVRTASGCAQSERTRAAYACTRGGSRQMEVDALCAPLERPVTCMQPLTRFRCISRLPVLSGPAPVTCVRQVLGLGAVTLGPLTPQDPVNVPLVAKPRSAKADWEQAEAERRKPRDTTVTEAKGGELWMRREERVAVILRGHVINLRANFSSKGAMVARRRQANGRSK